MKFILTMVMSASLFAVNAQAIWSDTVFVKRQNQNIVDGYQNSINLDGVNLGGWLMWEGWIWGGGFTQQKELFNDIENKLGSTAANNFRDSVYQNFITRSDIQKIAEQCFNVVRIPFNHIILKRCLIFANPNFCRQKDCCHLLKQYD